MVSLAAKELLRKSVKNANFHNKILEQHDMWRQWELEQGLTMMVSDDSIKKRHHLCKYHAQKRKRKQQMEKKESRKGSLEKPSKKKSVADSLEKWDHSGFEELYPNGGLEERRSRNTDSSYKSRHYKEKRTSVALKKRLPERGPERERWGHSGFKKLYPTEVCRDKDSEGSSSASSSPSTSSSYSSSSSKESSCSRRKSSRRREDRRSRDSSTSSSYTDSSSSTSSSTSESWDKKKYREVYGHGRPGLTSSCSEGSRPSRASHTSSKKAHRNL